MKCPALPPFENGTAWQTHFNTVHATSGPRTSGTSDKKGKQIVTVVDEGKDNGQQRDVSCNTTTEAQNMAKETEPPSSFAHVQNAVIGSPPLEVLTSWVNQDKIVLSALDDKADSQPVHHTAPNSEERSFDERGPLSFKGPTLNLLVEIDPESRRARNEVTYEIASDVWSPTVTATSIGTEEPEGEHDMDMSQSRSLELSNGSSLQKGQHIIVPPRGPKLGERESRTLSGAIVDGDCTPVEPNVNEKNGFGGATLSIKAEQHEGDRSDSPTSTTFGSQDAEQDTKKGDLPHDPLWSAGSKPAPSGVHFECRLCHTDPTPNSNLTATNCGHLFCYECIAAEVLRTSRCPVCKNVLALYCLFKLDVGS